MVNANSKNIIISWWLLYGFFAFFLIVSGIDKFFNFLVDWSIYLNEHIPAILNLNPKIFLQAAGIVEFIIGLLVLVKPKIGGYLTILLFIAIIINLITMGTHHHEGYHQVMTHYDVALHDLGMVIAAFVFVLLTKELEK